MNHFKSKSKKLEKLRGIFFQIGLIIAGGFTLLAFEWMSPIYSYNLPQPDEIFESDWDMAPIIPEKKIEKPKVKINQPKVDLTKFDIVKTLVDPIPDPNPDPTPDPVFVPDVEPTPDPDPAIFTIVEKMPEFFGGDKARIKYLKDNLKYPRVDKEGGIQGTVYLKFLVNNKGEIKDVVILRGVSETIDKEALRVVKAMPNWSPGKQRGKTVSVYYNLPITFALK